MERAVALALTPATSSAGLSRDGWRVLLMLARGGGRSMGDIAAHTGLPAPTATRVVDRLVAQRLAHRQGDPVDRRRVLVHLAAQGREVVDRVCGSIERRVGTALGAVDPRERVRLAQLLDELATSEASPAPTAHATPGPSGRRSR